jgi:hypothetical protein
MMGGSQLRVFDGFVMAAKPLIGFAYSVLLRRRILPAKLADCLIFERAYFIDFLEFARRPNQAGALLTRDSFRYVKTKSAASIEPVDEPGFFIPELEALKP